MVKVNFSFEFIKINIDDKNHQDALLCLMNDYMLDEMGLGRNLSKELGVKIIDGLREQNNYLGFFLKAKNNYIALANCFIGFSTFKAMQLINIHDYIVSPKYRRLGVGHIFLNRIVEFGKENNYCKVTLEVRHDNKKAQSLYRKLGFEECNPPMYFWKKELQNSD